MKHMSSTVLITGTSSGIGRLTAELMAKKGWQVAAASRSPQTLALDGVFPVRLDPSEEPSIAAAVKAVVERFGRLDALVNNAGFGLFGPLEGTSAEELDAYVRANLLGALNVIRRVMPVMRAQKDGTIVNVSSIGGLTSAPMASLYHACKFALEGFSESFRYEAALHGVRVKLVEPDHFKTGFLTRSLKLAKHEAYEQALDNYMQWVMKEDATAPDPRPVAEAILRAATDRSGRLRYRVGGGVGLAMSRLMPDGMWRNLMSEGMKRRPKGL